MKNHYRNIIDRLNCISLLILVLTVIPMGVILYKTLLLFGYRTFIVYLLIFFISWSFLVYYFNKTIRKSIDLWNMADNIAFILCFILVILSVQLLPDQSGFYVWSIILSILLFFLIISIVINLFICNKFLFIVFSASLIYGIINNNMYNVLLALVTYIMGSLDIDDIKKHFNLDIFDEKKFIKDKYLTMLAISSTALANVIGEPVLKCIFKRIELCFYSYEFDAILYRGGFRVIFASLIFMGLMYLYRKHINKLVKRYTSYSNRVDLEENISNNEDLEKCDDKLEQMPERKDLNIKGDFVKKDYKKASIFIIAFALVLGIAGKLSSGKEREDRK